jgi:hypothetical protein
MSDEVTLGVNTKDGEVREGAADRSERWAYRERANGDGTGGALQDDLEVGHDGRGVFVLVDEPHTLCGDQLARLLELDDTD